MSAGPGGLDRRIGELEAAALRLREPNLDPVEAAALVERCAELAAELSGELELQARAGRAEAAVPHPGQGIL